MNTICRTNAFSMSRWVSLVTISLTCFLLLWSCGGPKKINNTGEVDQEDLKKRAEEQARIQEEYAESQEIARLNALYNPWRLPKPALAQDGLGIWRQSQVAYVRPGYDALKSRMALLDGATRSVRVQTFIMSGDEVGQAFANKLIELITDCP